ncbi:MAG: Rieske (2Fe-2S) protein [Alphaproteobacteria bacterium]|nr:Rieske (2Fe-2S) protein [Alphaproteobacteria bacterium]
MSAARLHLCAATEISEGGARGFSFGSGADAVDIVLVRTKGALHAYLNACPHQGTPLETFPDRFTDPQTGLLVCSTHGARFRPEDGHCVSGPCKGEALRRLSLAIADGQAIVTLEQDQ